MLIRKNVLILGCLLSLGLTACSRQQSDWQKARQTNTAEAYEQFLKSYPSGEFTAQAQARLKELYEERDWQKARDADTLDAYQAFLRQHPEGKRTEDARIAVENFTLAQTPAPAAPGGVGAPSGAVPGGTPAPSGRRAPAGTSPSAGGTAPAANAARANTGTHPQAQTAEKQAASAAAKPGSYGVQLGAFKSGTDAADKHWDQLQRQFPELLAGLSSKVAPKKTAHGTLYRLQAVGISKKRARTICKQLKAKSQACVVIRPAHA